MPAPDQVHRLRNEKHHQKPAALRQVTRAEAPRESVHMAQVVTNVQARLSYVIQERQAQLILPQVWPDAVGYEPWVEEVWANLLSNALKYGGQPPHVELGASALSDGMLRFWTRDNGPGSRLRPVQACLHEAARSSTSAIRETGWVCRSCTTSWRSWAARWVSRAKKGKAVSFSLPCPPRYRNLLTPLSQPVSVRSHPGHRTPDAGLPLSRNLPIWRIQKFPDGWMRWRGFVLRFKERIAIYAPGLSTFRSNIKASSQNHFHC